MPSYYETLGVGVDASPEVIQRVYRQLAKAYHPDTNPDNPVGAEKPGCARQLAGRLSVFPERQRRHRVRQE